MLQVSPAARGGQASGVSGDLQTRGPVARHDAPLPRLPSGGGPHHFVPGLDARSSHVRPLALPRTRYFFYLGKKIYDKMIVLLSQDIKI